MKGDLILPAFEMDCRDWLVITPDDSGLPDEVAGTPLLAVMSTAVIDDEELRSASVVLTVGLMDDDELPAPDPGRVATELADTEDDRTKCFLLPVPQGPLALLAEFTMSAAADGELERRIEALMDSFRWAA